MTIDWSKAPEGATHWDTGLDGAVAGWMRVNEGQWYWWPVDGAQCERKWHVCLTPKQPKSDKYIARPWNGEGLPPVGKDVCEYRGAHQWDVWTVVNIFAEWGEGSRRVVFVDFGDGWRAERDAERFRTIRTADQIEAEERECAVTDMCVLLGKDPSRPGVRERAGVLYDAGYRKQVAP